MEATHHFYGMGMAEVRRIGKRSLEWDLNDWKWDGDLFIASQLNPPTTTTDYQSRQFFPPAAGIPATGNSSNSTSSCSDEVNLGLENEKDLEKRRRVVGFEHDNPNVVAAALSLNLGGDGKKAKLSGGGGSSSRAVCQVEDCGADLSNAKDYHRRHKVCEAHSKASSAVVGSTMQRFCQQCSRFHTLDEFDEGKRSCRRRLAGHNKRRRKTHPDAVKGNALNDEQSSGYLLISLLKIISNMQSNGSEQMSNQDLLSNILKILASNASVQGERNMSEVLQEPNEFSSGGTAIGNSKMASALLANDPQGTSGANEQQLKLAAHEIPPKQVYADDATGRDTQIASSSKVATQFPVKDSSPAYSEFPDNAVERIKMNTFDLNDEYVDLEDYSEDIERLPAAANLGNGSLECPLWIQQDSNRSSPPTSGHSDSTSALSPSSSGGDVQVRTDRIVFKLFGKEPKDIPVLLRAQVLDWLAHRPTDIESYIRPGCIILTIYLCLPESAWEELCCDLSSSLSRLLDVTHDTFWRTGWFYIRVQHQIAFIYDGQVVVDTPLTLLSNNYNKILSVKPIALSVSEKAHFVVKGLNLSQPGTRLLCGLEGKYLFQEATHELIEDGVKPQCLNFFCSIPMAIGRGFIEIEDEGLGSTCFPFIVADEDVCSEICMLESAIDFNEVNEDIQKGSGKLEAKNEATNFIHEMGWLLHRSHLKSRLSHSDPNTAAFPLERFKWLMEFSMEHDWCAVVKKLLDIFLEGTVGAGEHATLIVALREIGLLHRAVRRNCRPLVEILLRYVPGKVADELGSEFKSPTDGVNGRLLFRPNAVGPGGLTPLHIAAGRDGSEDVLDALTNDPGMVGIETWKSARDTTGCTPEDYARLRGHYSYIHLIQRKNNKRAAGGQVVLDMPGDLSDTKSSKNHLPSFEIARTESKPVRRNCSRCDRKLSYGNAGGSLVYRPAMLSMVAIAAVCVCVALLFKSSPLVYRQLIFRWEWLEYGPR